MKIFLSAILFSLLFIACGSTTTTTNSSETKIAYLYDNALNGVEYKCGDNISGLTGNANSVQGSFFYQHDCTVEFNIGKIYLGNISGNKIQKNSKIYPTNIVNTYTTDTNNIKAVNILRFVQTIDNDNNPLNGITISSTSRNNLQKSSTNALDLTRSDISDTLLQNAITSANPNRFLISKTKAISHFEEILRKYVDPSLDTIKPEKPIILNTISSINNQDITSYDFNISGEPNTNIYVAFNNDGNDSNLTYINKNIKLNQYGLAILNLDFNNTDSSHFHYFIRLQDNTQKESDYVHIDVLKDDEPPSVLSNNLQLGIEEEQNFIKNIEANDNVTNRAKIKYKVLNVNEDSRSINHALFQIDENGNVTFITEPDFDQNVNLSYRVVVRAQDEANNSTDVLLFISLKNILDNPPKLTNNIYTTNLLEKLSNNEIVYDVNSTLEHNLTLASDNDPSLSPINFYLHNYTNIFDLNSTSGVLSIKDSSNLLFDYEHLPNSVELNISVENNNTSIRGNVTYLKLNVNIINKIDTNPKLINPGIVSIYEHNNPISKDIVTIQKDTNLSDKNLTMFFSIINGNDGNFTINSTTGTISNINDTLDYETKKEYNLTIRATNIWFDGSTHYNEVNVTININNVIDNPPSITYSRLKSSIPEQSNGTFNIANFDTNGTIYDQNQTTSYSIVSVVKNGNNLSSHPFNINSNTGILSTNTTNLDSYYDENETNESVTTYTIKVIAKNKWWNNTEHNSNELNFDINITNVIDNKPVLKVLIPQSFEENTSTPIGTLIATIETNGSIYDENNASKFYIVSGNDENKFEINNITGQIRLKKLLDWETTKNYNLQLYASNIWWNGNEVNSSIISLDINITNKIEKAPKIVVPSILNIHENIDSNTIIAFIETNSSEDDEQNISNITISAGNDGNFSIEYIKASESLNNLPYAKLKIANPKNINYDKNNTYLLEINATNEYNSTIKTIPINIIDDIDTNISLLVLMVDYNDINFSTTFADVENLIFTNGGGNDKNLLNYFSRISKNKFTFKPADESYNSSPASNGIIKIHLNRNHPDNSETQLKEDIKNAIIASDNNCTYSTFDKNNDGKITSNELQIILLIAGGERTYGDDNKSINAIADSLTIIDNNLTIDGVILKNNFIAIGELINTKNTTIGLIAKFISEKLLNFKQDSNINYQYGSFDLMGDGFKGYENNETLGTTPIHPSIFNKMQQGWVTPRIFRKNLTYIHDIYFYNTHDEDNFNAIKIDTNNPNRYYLIENRNYTTQGSTNNYDNGLYAINDSNFSGGLAIWEFNNNTIKLIDINHSNDNIFRPINTTDDFYNSYFEFYTVGTIEDSNQTDGSKKYSIQIKVK